MSNSLSTFNNALDDLDLHFDELEENSETIVSSKALINSLSKKLRTRDVDKKDINAKVSTQVSQMRYVNQQITMHRRLPAIHNDLEEMESQIQFLSKDLSSVRANQNRVESLYKHNYDEDAKKNLDIISDIVASKQASLAALRKSYNDALQTIGVKGLLDPKNSVTINNNSNTLVVKSPNRPQLQEKEVIDVNPTVRDIEINLFGEDDDNIDQNANM